MSDETNFTNSEPADKNVRAAVRGGKRRESHTAVRESTDRGGRRSQDDDNVRKTSNDVRNAERNNLVGGKRERDNEKILKERSIEGRGGKRKNSQGSSSDASFSGARIDKGGKRRKSDDDLAAERAGKNIRGGAPMAQP